MMTKEKVPQGWIQFQEFRFNWSICENSHCSFVHFKTVRWEQWLMIVLRFIHLNCIIDIIIVFQIFTSHPPYGHLRINDLSSRALLNLSRVFSCIFQRSGEKQMMKIHPVKPHNNMQHLDTIIRKPRICSKANYCGCAL